MLFISKIENPHKSSLCIKVLALWCRRSFFRDYYEGRRTRQPRAPEDEDKVVRLKRRREVQVLVVEGKLGGKWRFNITLHITRLHSWSRPQKRAEHKFHRHTFACKTPRPRAHPAALQADRAPFDRAPCCVELDCSNHLKVLRQSMQMLKCTQGKPRVDGINFGAWVGLSRVKAATCSSR